MIKNIIFDLGGVILNINFKKMYDAFEALGAKQIKLLYAQMTQHHIIDQFEMGKITPHQFRDSLRKILNLTLSDEQLDQAWNAMLLDLPTERSEYIQKIKKQYQLKTFLLSNTNAIHLEAIRFQHGHELFKKCFDKEYYSHELGNRKPNHVVFQCILNENHLQAEDTLFLDDSPQHVNAALEVGLQARLITPEFSVLDIEKIL